MPRLAPVTRTVAAQAEGVAAIKAVKIIAKAIRVAAMVSS
jgi:hypothetical protein